MKTRAHGRGQALVELAIGSLLLITLLLIGIHLSEVVYLSLKVTEASSLTVFESTGKQAHNYELSAVSAGVPGPTIFQNPFNRIVSGPTSPANSAISRYADFNGLPPNGSGYTGLFTSGEALDVRCEKTTASGPPPTNPLWWGMPFRAMNNPLRAGKDVFMSDLERRMRQLYQGDEGGLACSAQATIRRYSFPNALFEASGGIRFKEALLERTQFNLCGVGPPGSTCAGKLGIILGDWAMDGPIGSDQNRDVRLRTRDRFDNPLFTPTVYNRPYHYIIRELYIANGRSAGNEKPSLMNQARRYAAELSNEPIDSFPDESRFFMSSAGEERPTPLKDGHPSDPGFPRNTNGSLEAFRSSCFLGLPCSGTLIR